jgi:hypothetical protein
MKVIALALVIAVSPAFADVLIDDNNKTVTVDCAKDKSVMVNGNGAKITLKGTCTNLLLSGNGATISGSVADVMISGNNNKLALEATLSIKVSGNDNTVGYKKSTDANKKVGVLNSGERNKIAQAK